MDNITNQINCAPPCTELLLMKKDIENLSADMQEVKTTLKLIDAKFDEQSEKLNKKFAGKWTESAVIMFISLLALSSIYLILNHVGLPTN